MKQIIPYALHYANHRAGITKRRSLKTDLSWLFSTLAVILFFANPAISQNCPTSGTHSQSSSENTYYPGAQASIATGATSITLGAAGSGTNFGSTPIAIGDIVLIIQMQGAQINTANTSAYGAGIGTGAGNTATNFVAGRMEFGVAANSVPLAGGTLNLVAGTTYAYTKSAYGTWGQYTYQVIRVPTFYDITLTGTVTTPLWNGSTGGVTVINAVNQLNFNSKTINATGAGFRGGAGRVLGGASGLNKTDYVTLSTVTSNGSKAEGSAGTPTYLNNSGTLLNTGVEGYPSGSYGRGAPGNAGGGGTDFDPSSNDQNDGGGGGGNGGAGGRGGNGWYLVGTSGGKGGASFSATASPSRLVLGGGGGAGTTNNATGTPGSGFASSGAAGGGLVIISSTSITGSGTVNVSGLTANNTVTNDASGGGGAGGSILIYANSGHSGVTAIAKGGDGGSNDPAATGATQHGPGGGGGGGIIYSNATLNGASSAAAGLGGISTGTDATDNFGAANGNAGVLTQTFPFAQLPPNMQKCQTAILPVTLLNFNATYQSSNTVQITWTTGVEINSNYFEVERSEDAVNFDGIGQVAATRTEESTHDYSFPDYLSSVHSSVIYYRLKMVDIDGKYSYSRVVAISLNHSDASLSIYPNPASDYAVLKISAEKQTTAIMRLMDDAGKQIATKSLTVNKGSNNIVIDQIAGLAKGVYFVQVIMNNGIYNEKLMKR